MPKKRTKTDFCLNCGHETGDSIEYCPVCGQENRDQNLPITQLIGEFLSTFLALDSRFVSSLKPFFFKPGFLTNRFNEGQRVHYSNPVRLYVVTSVLYFFVISLYLGGIIIEGLEKNPDSFMNIDSGKASLLERWNELETDSAKVKLLPDSLRSQYTGVQSADSLLAMINEDFMTETGYSLFQMDSIRASRTETAKSFMDRIKDGELTDEELLSSMDIDPEKNSQFLVFGALKLRKLLNNQAYFVDYAFRNLSLMMLIAIPLFAAILKLFYIRGKRLYIQHIIHGLHIHSFGFILFSVATVLMYNLNASNTTLFWIGALFFMWVTGYSYFSFRRVYKQGWFKTLVKFLFVGYFYFTALIFLLVAELYATFMLF
ncbi:DUF3667 domain-containing protein [Fulvivirgaceae bacterium LMO-SS25]